jgi:hypothetical protein
MPPPEELSEREMEDIDGKGKVSRWQIGNGSLSVLEQVYAMEPFPGTKMFPCLVGLERGWTAMSAAALRKAHR